MKFKEVPNKVDFVALEHSILKFWDKSQAFQKLRTLRSGGKPKCDVNKRKDNAHCKVHHPAKQFATMQRRG